MDYGIYSFVMISVVFLLFSISVKLVILWIAQYYGRHGIPVGKRSMWCDLLTVVVGLICWSMILENVATLSIIHKMYMFEILHMPVVTIEKMIHITTWNLLVSYFCFALMFVFGGMIVEEVLERANFDSTWEAFVYGIMAVAVSIYATVGGVYAHIVFGQYFS